MESVALSHTTLKCCPNEPEIPQADDGWKGDPNQLHHAPAQTSIKRTPFYVLYMQFNLICSLLVMQAMQEVSYKSEKKGLLTTENLGLKIRIKTSAKHNWK